MRLIDADRLKSYIDAQKGRPFIGCTVGEALKIMTDEQPTIDAVEVVRCKDCKWWYLDADTEMACEYTEMGQPEDGYCNWAERRSDE